MKKSIVIVDDHVLIAQALKGIIANFPDFEVWYECENGKDLQHQLALKNKVPDVVLMDISMPEMNGFEATLWLKEHHPNVLVLALSMQDDDESVIKMVKNGAKGYLLKNSHPTELEKALKAITTVGFYYPDWAASKVFASLGIAEVNKKTKSDLTDREKEFLRFTVTEMSYKEIAEKMFCSPRTVESYRDSLFEKLEIKTRVGLAVFAMKNGYDTL